MHYEALRQLCHERQQDRLREAEARRLALRMRAERRQQQKQQQQRERHPAQEAAADLQQA